MNSDKVDIVLVEDNIDDAELAIRALKKNNVSSVIIHHLKDGEEALDYIFCRGVHAGRNRDFPKLILLDIKMPKVNGLEVLKQLKSDDHMKLIPVVLFTSSNQSKDIIESYQLGANSYIVKPVDYNIFMKTISDLSEYWLGVNQYPVPV